MTLPLPERLRAVLERLGPTFVKAGQMLALRPDYVPLEYAEALRSLHDAVAPFPGVEAERAVAAELGAPLTELFAVFEREPFAAASLDPKALEEAWRENRFEYLELALELPDLLPELAERLRDGRASAGPPPAPSPSRPWLPLAGGFLAGAVAARLLGRRG